MAIHRLCVAVCCFIMAQATKIEDAQDLNFEPKIAVQCQRVAKHIDVNTGKWTDDSSSEVVCSSDPKEILKYCQKTYPDIAITNIVEANENATICSGKECKSSFSVLPYRCLVGKFEADALSYPFDAQCDFGYIHESKTCKNHGYWNERANQICKGKGKHLEKYGILVPCATDLFTGVEYVCCKKRVTTAAPTEVVEPTTKPKTAHEMLNDLLNKFAARIPESSHGCDRSIFEGKTDLLHVEKDGKVTKLAKDLNHAKARMEEMKKDDPDQAKTLFKKTLQIFQSTLKNIESQAKLDESRLSQEKKECGQLAINHKKHLAMTAFVDAVRKHSDKPDKIIKTFQRFMHVLETDQDQNMRSLSKKLLAKGPKKLMSARESFMSHLKILKSALREGVEILKHVKSVHGEIKFNLPPFASDIDFEFAHKPKTTPPPPTTEAPPTEKRDETLGLNEDELSNEHEHEDEIVDDDIEIPSKTPGKNKPHIGRKHKDGKHHHGHPLKSRAVFAAVIGLSCGALVIMIVIVLALFFRKRSPKRNTKTVIADDDSQEKRHLLKMQEDGFENPTYKFFAN